MRASSGAFRSVAKIDRNFLPFDSLCLRSRKPGSTSVGRKQLEAERRLVEASRRHPRRFAELYERYFDRVYAFALTRTNDRTATEDVTADTFRQAFENLSRFQWRGVPFSAWLFRIAANAAADQVKRAAKEVELLA